MNFMETLYDTVLNKYGGRFWAYDGRWLSYWEGGFYRPGLKGCGPDPCFAKNHGHLSGDNSYREWINIQNLFRGLRQRHPRLCLEQYYGLKRGEVWAMRWLNAADNYYETSGDTMNRFQTWHNQNDRFRPAYKNYTCIWGKTPQQFKDSFISCLSVARYCQVGPAFNQLNDKGCREFLKKWRAWGSQNLAYLKDRRDLFDGPGLKKIDGSAHLIKDRGYLFLFRADGTSTRTALRASIPLNRWLGLAENPKATYRISEIYPRENQELGIYHYGEDLRFDMPEAMAVILSVTPAAVGEPPSAPPDAEVVEAFSRVKPDLSALGEWSAAGALALTADTRWHRRQPVKTGSPGEKGEEIFIDAVDAPTNVGDLKLAAPTTLSFWMKARDLAADQRIMSQLQGAPNQAGGVRICAARVQAWDGVAYQTLIESGLQANEWLHVALVFDADGQAKGYLNGQPRPARKCGIDCAGVETGLGAPFLGTYGQAFNGEMKDFRILRRSLSPTDIRRLYEKDRPNKSDGNQERRE